MEKNNKVYKISFLTTIMHGINTIILGVLGVLTIITAKMLWDWTTSTSSLIERTGGDQVGGWAKFFGMIGVFYVSVGIVVILIFLVITLIPFILNIIAVIKGAITYNKRRKTDVLQSIKRNDILKLVANGIAILTVFLVSGVVLLILGVAFEIIIGIFGLLGIWYLGLVVAEVVNIVMITGMKPKR